MRWIGASPHLTHLHMINLPLHYLPSALSAAPSLANLTSLGCILLTTDDSDWQPLLSVLETKGAIGRNGRIDTLGVYFAVEGMEPDGILTSLRALDTAIQRFAGVGVSAADTHVTAIPIASWEDHIMTNVISQPHHQAGSSGAAPSFSSAAAACEPPVGGGRRAPLFPNMVSRADDDNDASGEMADRQPTQRPFKLLVYVPSEFDDNLLRLPLTASDVLPKKIVREMARVAESMEVKAVSSTASAAARGSFGDYVFESLTELTIHESVAVPVTSGVLPSVPAVPYSRFPSLSKRVLFKFPSFHLLREGGVRELLAATKGQLEKITVTLTDFPSRYDTSYGTGQPPPREAAPGLLAQLTLECLDASGHVDELVLAFFPNTWPVPPAGAVGAGLLHRSPIYHLFATPELAARLPPIKQLTLSTPYCVHDRFGNVQMDFIMDVINNTPELKKVEISEVLTALMQNAHFGLLRHFPAYLASANGAVDEALASAGSPFVVVRADDTRLTLER
ncbi:unnamed protein product [Vitrella brassicaformis CCMP3155]|uniref:Uncharacterized protein n=1 Tax=Vitrella brassicaformis (strain CCMP3155) TaxID=1169540 RepID=A0A0G4GBF5_VITBC|nr:unnamed protein product [Vitrella brassicaformis CCMP3155]|eukprot:CEM26479.1 unnamed protein product [Vitrella brassicaformis CCMP3155]